MRVAVPAWFFLLMAILVPEGRANNEDEAKPLSYCEASVLEDAALSDQYPGAQLAFFRVGKESDPAAPVYHFRIELPSLSTPFALVVGKRIVIPNRVLSVTPDRLLFRSGEYEGEVTREGESRIFAVRLTVDPVEPVPGNGKLFFVGARKWLLTKVVALEELKGNPQPAGSKPSDLQCPILTFGTLPEGYWTIGGIVLVTVSGYERFFPVTNVGSLDEVGAASESLFGMNGTLMVGAESSVFGQLRNATFSGYYYLGRYGGRELDFTEAIFH